MLRTSLLLCGLLAAPFALAGPIRAGLWEVETANMQVAGQDVPAMQEMLAQLKNLPPQQRQMMEEMMKQQGVSLGDSGVRVCLSQAQVDTQEIPLQESGCSQEITERTDQLLKFRYSCPDSSGEGEARFVSDREMVTRVSGTAQGQPTQVETRSRWISADCGGLTPAR
ncbi:DUF3617 domain-containing protein [Pseudomonas mangrovi]|uniref:DUF3617 domain-containing protein n=1 Tax=Pseudomonas mangrovi TaxID=2161748 RepID=A0A2T5P9Q1_9PSED|nr:DUF3617 domain-containing protein [Pseudomonas mangrovi]PTU74464.1 DUF3617 domain-containing protein [Pseudomonas mangrovi]